MSQRNPLIADLWQCMSDSPFIMIGKARGPVHSEPMTAQFDERTPNALFLFMHADNRLIEGSGGGPVEAVAQFIDKGHDLFACMHGTLRQVPDRHMIDRLWSKPIEAWFDEGKQDPSMRLLRFDLREVEIWKAELPFKEKMKMVFGGSIDVDAVEDKHAHAVM